jgi:amyloid beta precursor protein binding protein 1
VHSHIPYNIILIQALQAWKDSHDGQPPKTIAEKKEFKARVEALSRDIGKESNFIEASRNIHKCY